MKKTGIFLLCAFLFSSCSMTLDQVFLIPTQTPTPASTNTITPTDVPTFTATIATSTYTVTPTLSGQRTVTPTLDFTPTVSSFTPLALFTPNTSTPPVEMKGFVNVFTSKTEFFKAGVCEPTSVKFTAQVANPEGTAFVVLFVRFKSKLTGATSAWTSITMQSLVAGTFVHDLTSGEMKAVDSFPNGWVQYQFVATDSNSHEIGRTGIVSESLTLLECHPTPTPFISLTPTVIKP